MALRTIRMLGDEMLSKPCRPVTNLTARNQELIDDMLETMYEANGVGLAAPQVGVLRQIVVVDIGAGPLIMVNPEIIASEGEQTGDEGCLSFPGKAGQVTRPQFVTVRYYDREMDLYELSAEDLLARAICHEVDHLSGHMYVEFVEGQIHDVNYDEEEEEDGEYDGEEDGEYDEDTEPDEEEEITMPEPVLIRRHDECE